MKFEEIAKCEIIDNSKYEEVMVSVYCLTYNHIAYIRDALDGFLCQDMPYSYEIIVFDDASTDGTSDVIREYARKYPDLIRAFIAHKNTYGTVERKAYFADFLERTMKGKYVIECEGDDYWNDSNKLNLQVSIMVKDPCISMSLHNAIWLDCKLDEVKLFSKRATSGYVTASDFICKERVGFPTAAMLFRRDSFFPPKVLTEGYSFSDYQCVLNAALKGRIYYFSEIMSVYRYLSSGSWSELTHNNAYGLINHCIAAITMLEKYEVYSDHIYTDYVLTMQNNYLHLIAAKLESENVDTSYYKTERELYIIEKAEQLYKSHSDFGYAMDRIESYLKKNPRLYIMGAGQYGKKMKKALDDKKIEINGFIVSSSQEKELLGKPIIEINSLSESEKSTMGIVVGIDPRKYPIHSIVRLFNENGITNYNCPFWVWETGKMEGDIQ